MKDVGRKYQYVKTLLTVTLAELDDYVPPSYTMIGANIESYINEFLVFDISVPRQYGKTIVIENLKHVLDFLDDDRVAIVQSNDLTKSLRGYTRPFGDNVEILIFDEFFDSAHIKAIAENWFHVGYKKLPKIIVLRTNCYDSRTRRR